MQDCMIASAEELTGAEAKCVVEGCLERGRQLRSASQEEREFAVRSETLGLKLKIFTH